MLHLGSDLACHKLPEFGDESPKSGFIVRQGTLEQTLSSEISGDGVMGSFVNVYTEKDWGAFRLFDISQGTPLQLL